MGLMEYSVLITALFFAAFAVTGSITAALSARMLWPVKVLNSGADIFSTPLWELTNLYLLLGFSSAAVLFGSAFNLFAGGFFYILALAVSLQVLRFITYLYIFYKNAWRPILWLYPVIAYGALIGFIAAGAFLLTGSYFWDSLLGWVIMVSGFWGCLAVGFTVINRTASSKARYIADLFFLIWMLFAGSVLPLTSQKSGVSWRSDYLILLVVVCFIALVVVGIKLLRNNIKPPWRLVVLVGVAVPVLLAQANAPYLINRQLTITEALGADSYAKVAAYFMTLVFVLVTLGLTIIFRQSQTSAARR